MHNKPQLGSTGNHIQWGYTPGMEMEHVFLNDG